MNYEKLKERKKDWKENGKDKKKRRKMKHGFYSNWLEITTMI